jgi:hypothetical protein
MKMHMLR